jgi:hypothetical protein
VGDPVVRRFAWDGDREHNKRASAQAVLELLLDRVEAAGATSANAAG